MHEPDRHSRPRIATGDHVRDWVESERLADLAIASASYHQAIEYLTGALALFPHGEESPAKTAVLRRKIGWCLERLRKLPEAVAVLERALEDAEAAGDAAERGRVRVERGKVEYDLDRYPGALSEGERALVDLAGPGLATDRGFAQNLVGAALQRMGRIEDAGRAFHRALEEFKSAGDIRNLPHAYNNLGLYYKSRCEWRRALEYFQVSINLHAIEGDYEPRLRGLQNVGVLYAKQGEWTESLRAFEEVLTIARSAGTRAWILRGLIGRAGVETTLGRRSEARESLSEAEALLDENTSPRERFLYHRTVCRLLLEEGDQIAARNELDRAEVYASSVSADGELATEGLRTRAEILLTAGAPAEALLLAERAVSFAETAGDRYEASVARRFVARAEALLGERSRSLEVAARSIRAFRETGERHQLALLLVENALTRLEGTTAAREILTALADLEEARGLAESLALPGLLARVHLVTARGLLRRGELEKAWLSLEAGTEAAGEEASPVFLAELETLQAEVETRVVRESSSHENEFRLADRVATIVESDEPLDLQLSSILRITLEATSADGGALFFRGGEAAAPVPLRENVSVEFHTALSKILARHAGRVGAEPVLVLHAATAREPWLREVAALRGASAFLLVPIADGGAGGAVLYLDRLRSRGLRPFRQRDVNLAVVLAGQAGLLLRRRVREEKRSAGNALREEIEKRIYLADVVTQDSEMLSIVSLVGKINRSRLTILLEGETGTGKTLIARAVHQSSDRAAGPFVTLDCAALPETLLESELFGHVKGSFTGAMSDKKGLFEEADGGTILLDEIGKAGLPTQRRLLHFLDKGEVRPVGATTYRKLDVRVICATSNRNLRADVEKGAFLKDLFYRLNDIMIKVPPLRERVEDVALLAEYFLATFKAETRRELAGISRAAMTRLEQYDWPGNVRELEKAIRRAAILCDDGGWITPELLPPEVTGGAGERRTGRQAEAPPLKGLLEETERRVVRQALEQNGWNKSQAARSLGLSRKGLKNKIQRYGLDRRAR